MLYAIQVNGHKQCFLFAMFSIHFQLLQKYLFQSSTENRCCSEIMVLCRGSALSWTPLYTATSELFLRPLLLLNSSNFRIIRNPQNHPKPPLAMMLPPTGHYVLEQAPGIVLVLLLKLFVLAWIKSKAVIFGRAGWVISVSSTCPQSKPPTPQEQLFNFMKLTGLRPGSQSKRMSFIFVLF